jgi:hypothetical protein
MKQLTLFILAMAAIGCIAQGVGIGTITPDPSSALDITTVTKGFLPPRMTSLERDVLSNPAEGLMIYNTTLNRMQVFNGTAWSSSATAATDIASPALKKLLGGTGDDRIYAIEPLSDGGYILTGWLTSSKSGTLSLLPNAGGIDIWVIRLTKSGYVQWQKVLGGAGDDYAYSIVEDKDGGFVIAGNTTSSATGLLGSLTNNGGQDAWIIKLDGGGGLVWQKLYGGTADDYTRSISQTADGGYIIAGSSTSTNSGTLTGVANNGFFDGWVFKLNNVGGLQWQKLLGGTVGEELNSVQQTPAGDYVLAGYAQSSNTGSLTGVTGNGSADAWIVLLNSAGTMQWQKLLGGTGYDNLQKIQPTTDGGYIAAGSAQSSNTGTLSGVTNNGLTDGWVIKLNSAGTTQWQKLSGGTGDDLFFDIRVTVDAGYILSGKSASSNTGTLTGVTSNGGEDEWVQKTDAAGTVQWEKLLGGSANEESPGICVVKTGGYLVAGFTGSVNTGNLAGTFSWGSRDGWLLPLTPQGQP